MTLQLYYSKVANNSSGQESSGLANEGIECSNIINRIETDTDRHGQTDGRMGTRMDGWKKRKRNRNNVEMSGEKVCIESRKKNHEKR